MAVGFPDTKTNPITHLEALLRGEIPDPLETDWIIEANLSAYCYRILPNSHPAKPLLRHHRMMQEARHQVIKSQLRPLLQAWAEAGLKTVLLKGFALAEFVYVSAGERHYGDIDVLIDQTDAKAVLQIAQNLGWVITYSRQEHLVDYRHEEAHIFSPEGEVRIDLHRRVVKQERLLDSGNRHRFTKAVWSRAVKQSWENTHIWLLEPIDFLLIGLLVHRVLGDNWRRKPHDLLDAKMLVGHYGIQKEQVLSRAKELRCIQTTLLALQTCDPWVNLVRLQPPTQMEIEQLIKQTHSELGSPTVEKWVNRILHAPLVVRLWVPAAIELSRIKRMLKNSGDLYLLLQSLEPSKPQPKPQTLKSLSEVTLGVKNALRVLGPHVDNCVPRSLTLYKMLRSKGYEVEFVSGVRRDNGKLIGHAWIEYQGRPIEGFRDETAPALYKENFRYPKK